MSLIDSQKKEIAVPLKADNLKQDLPEVNLNTRFPDLPEITKAHHYIKLIPDVFSDHMAFNWRDHDYEITKKDLVFLKELNQQIEDKVFP